jgi:hypothetical protein
MPSASLQGSAYSPLVGLNEGSLIQEEVGAVVGGCLGQVLVARHNADAAYHGAIRGSCALDPVVAEASGRHLRS